jgi:glutamate synthase domain-containing protein 3
VVAYHKTLKGYVFKAMTITVGKTHYKQINDEVRACADSEVVLNNVYGQRYIAAGSDSKTLTINGTPGNALGCYLNGSKIIVNGNSQDATGDTMNEGEIIVKGHSGDATGYGMRGGKILIKGNTGYRCGIHMKAYETKIPVIIVGGVTGSCLGEYQAGGTLVVFGLNNKYNRPITGDFCGTGIHGGKIILRCGVEEIKSSITGKIIATTADKAELAEIETYANEYVQAFGGNVSEIMNSEFTVLKPDTKNPYKQLYTHC